MSAFDECSKIERQGIRELIPFIKRLCVEGRYVLPAKGRLAKTIQRIAGDFLFNRAGDERLCSIEFKIERQNRSGNFFLEEYSNKKWNTKGWMYHCRADWLFYYFLMDSKGHERRQLFIMHFAKLKNWAFQGQGRIQDFPLKPQREYVQLNDTWGRCVPIDVIRREVGFNEYIGTWQPNLGIYTFESPKNRFQKEAAG